MAEQLYKIWCAFNRDHPQRFVAEFNRSGLHAQSGDLAEAVAALNKVIEINPNFMPAHINLGGFLERSGSADAAIAQWSKVTSAQVTITGQGVMHHVMALKQTARVLLDHNRHAQAEDILRQCLEIAPEQRDVLEQYVAARMVQCKWPVLVGWEGVPRETLVRGVSPLSMAAYVDDPLMQLAGAVRYVRQGIDKTVKPSASDCRHAKIDTKRRLKIGYISSDLREHAVGYLMAEMFELHDRAKFEIFAYYCGPASSDALNARIKAAVEHWVDINSLSDEAAAEKIAADGIDILVDVNGLTRFARTGTFARRPAPILVNWLGFPGTMGSAYHQYIIADDWIIPPGDEIYYTEKVLRLPCYQPNDRKRIVAERPTRAQFGLPQDAVVFCCFNGAFKINRFTFDRWMQILKRVPNSVLWLLENSPEANERLRDYAEQAGVERSRIIYAAKQPNAHHLARYPLADLFLDTSPYGAHTTASDALWMGVPVLTFAGRGFAARVCASLVRAAGLEDLVCDGPQDFIERAVALGCDPAALQAYKDRLAANRDSCLLFDMNRLTTELEGLYRKMAADHQKGLTPQPDLTNVEEFLDVRVGDDHESEDILLHPDYRGFYKQKLTDRHRMRPLGPDNRFWTAQDIAAADAKPA